MDELTEQELRSTHEALQTAIRISENLQAKLDQHEAALREIGHLTGNVEARRIAYAALSGERSS